MLRWLMVSVGAAVLALDALTGQVLVHLAVPVGLAAVLLGIVAVVCRRWWIALTAVAIVLVALALVLPSLLVRPQSGPPLLRVMTVNLQGFEADLEALAALVAREQVDVLALQEVPGVPATSLVVLRPVLPNLAVVPDPRPATGTRIAILTRLPVLATAVERVGEGEGAVPVTSLRVTVSTGGGPAAVEEVVVRTLHLRWPLPPLGRVQGVQAAAVAAWNLPPASAELWLADWNLTPWSPRFRAIIAGLGLDQPVLVGPTWQAFDRVPEPLSWAVGVPIDQILSCGGVRIGSLRIGPSLGSDHRPVLAEVVAAPGRRCRTQ
ncbi:MAG: endonuclease/exonuclease/phosphatase family protein [Alphaproteobacteria bacterium]|nr:endonuclease/exonuclease/phosphatase family protein [Alphaproteobacteria bacterium]